MYSKCFHGGCFEKDKRSAFFYRYSNCVPKFHLNVDLISEAARVDRTAQKREQQLIRQQEEAQHSYQTELQRCTDAIWKDISVFHKINLLKEGAEND